MKNTKNNRMIISALSNWFINTLNLDGNEIQINKGAREILKCTAGHAPEDRDFDNFITDMCYVGANWLNYTDDDIIKDGKDTWMKYFEIFMDNFFNKIDM